MRKYMNKIGTLLLALLLAAVLQPEVVQAESSKRKKGKKSAQIAKPATPKLTAYEKLFKDKQFKTADGLFKLHLIAGKLYMEIPAALLDREFVINTTIEESSLADYGLAGQQPLPPYHISFSCKDSLIRMHELPHRVISDKDKGIEKALTLNTTRPIVGSYSIKAYNADSTAVVIDATKIFLSDNKHLKAFEAHGISPMHVSKASYKSDRSLLHDVEGGNDYSAVISDMTYGVTTQYFIFITCKDKPFTARARRTITMLPKTLAKPRIADPRIGVMPVPYTRFTTEQGSRPSYFASRINFRKNGKVQPITLYIDTLFTTTWQRGISRGISLWNEAFRRIGMGDVLQTASYPTGKFDSNDPTKFYVKYVASANPKVTVNLITDPRSGEITGGRIHLPENLTNEIRTRRFLDLSAVDPAARDMYLDEEELCSSLAIYTARGVAQLLGLATNYAAAAAYPTDSLRSATFTRKNGLCSSITALNNYNYLAQPEDRGVRLTNDCLGLYDYFAIRWLYGDIAGANTPEEEQKVLCQMLREKASDPAYYYGNFWYDYYFGDVRLAYYNLGDDPVKRCTYRLRNLKYISKHAATWLQGHDRDGDYRKEAISAISTGTREIISYLAAYIGGVYYTEVAEGDGQSMLRVVPKDTQRHYVQKVLQLLEDLAWLDSPLTAGTLTNLSQSVQLDCLATLIKRMENLTRYQNSLPNAYTPAEMAKDMSAYIFRDVLAGRKLSEYNKRLQSAFTGIIIGGSKVLAEPKTNKRRNRSFADIHDGELQSVFPYEATMLLQPIKAYGKYRKTYYAKDFSEHIYYGILLNVRDIYRQGINVARDTDSRNFCQYMYRRINETLRIH